MYMRENGVDSPYLFLHSGFLLKRGVPIPVVICISIRKVLVNPTESATALLLHDHQNAVFCAVIRFNYIAQQGEEVYLVRTTTY